MPSIPDFAWTRPFDAPADPGHRPKVAGHHDGGALHGVPLGGFGTGGINRDWRGQFRRWTLATGAVTHGTEAVNGFALAVIGPEGPRHAECLQPRAAGDPALGAWGWPAGPMVGAYHGLFPKAWYDYSASADRPVHVLCEQFSPVLPGDEAACALPVGLFRWTIHNPSDEPLTVGLMASFANLVGRFTGAGREVPTRHAAGLVNQRVDTSLPDGRPVRAIRFARAEARPPTGEGQGEMALAVAGGPDLTLSHVAGFDARGDGAAIWQPFAATGRLTNDDRETITGPGFTEYAAPLLGGAVAASVTLPPGARRTVEMALVWDLPLTVFGSGARYTRRYTRDWGAGGDRAIDLAVHGLAQAAGWSAAIDAWHTAERATDEAAGRSADFTTLRLNELYLLVDGLTAWTDSALDGGPAEDFFGVIECPDYPFHNTLDLWVYGSFALARHWPGIAAGVIRDYAKATLADDPRLRQAGTAGPAFPITVAGQPPHDLGAPEEHPIALVNAYTYRNPNPWRDLPAQFVLTVWRDGQATGDAGLLADCWPAVRASMDRLASFDADGDGLPEHSAEPDQTIDNVRLTGPSAYCGGLTLAALAAAEAIAERVGDPDQAALYRATLERGREAFEGLWTGTHYRLDRDSAHGDAVFIDQLFGPWLAKVTGLGDLVDPARARTALTTIYESNALYHDGTLLGLATIRGLEGGDAHALASDPNAQTAEVLIGINLSFANQAETWGLTDMAGQVRAAIYRAVYVERGLWFRTPAAIDAQAKTFRAIMNMRPLVASAAGWGGAMGRRAASAMTE